MQENETIVQPEVAVQEAPAQADTSFSAGLGEEFPSTFYSKTPQQPTLDKETQAPETTPTQETPVTDTEPKAQEVPSSPATETPSVPEFDPLAWFREQTKGEYEKPEDLLALATADPVSRLPQHEQDLIRVARAGVDPIEYMQMQKTDFTKMEPKEMLKYDFFQQNKDIPENFREAAFNRELAKKYPNLDMGDDDEEAQLDTIMLTREANAISAKWEAEKEKMRLSIPENKQPEGPSQEEIDALAAKHLAGAKAALANTKKSYEVKAGDKLANIALERKAVDPALESAVMTPDQFIVDRYVDKTTGTYNHAQLEEDYDFIINRQSWLNAAFEQGLSARDSAILNTLEHPEPNASIAHPNLEVSDAEIGARIAAETKRAMGNSRFNPGY